MSLIWLVLGALHVVSMPGESFWLTCAVLYVADEIHLTRTTA